MFPRGKFAVVKKCVEKATGKQYAAKFLRKRRKGTDCRMDILNEIAVLELAKANPYVVELQEVYETSTEIILVLEWWADALCVCVCMLQKKIKKNPQKFTKSRLTFYSITNLVAFNLLWVYFLDSGQ